MPYPWDDYEWPEPRQTFFGDPRIMDMAQAQLTGPESFPVVPPPMAFPPGPDRSGPSPWRIAVAESLRDRPIQPGGDTPLLAFLSGALSRGGDVFSRRTLADAGNMPSRNAGSLARLNAANATAAGQVGTARLAGLKSISGAMKVREEARAKAAAKGVPYDPSTDPEILRAEEMRRRGLGTYYNKPDGGSGNGTQASATAGYIEDTTSRIVQQVDRVLPRVGPMTSGAVGSVMRFVPGSAAKDVQADLSSVAANVGFQALAAMREASKTGGALGQISDRENVLLAAVQGSIIQDQSTENLAKNLRIVRASMQRFANGKAQLEGKPIPYPDAPGPEYDGKEEARSAKASGGPSRVRVAGPNGETGTVPAGTAMPPGWRIVQ